MSEISNLSNPLHGLVIWTSDAYDLNVVFCNGFNGLRVFPDVHGQRRERKDCSILNYRKCCGVIIYFKSWEYNFRVEYVIMIRVVSVEA